MGKKLNMKFQIRGVEILEMELKQPTEIFPQQITYNFNLSVEHKVSSEQKLILVLIGVKIRNKGDKANILGSILVNCIFAIENFDMVVKKIDPQKYDIPDEIIDLLNSISISTTRGVMASLFKGTFLHGAVLPVIDPKSLSKKREPKKQKSRQAYNNEV